VNIIGTTTFNSTPRALMMQEMITRGSAPTSVHTLRRLMLKADAGQLVLDTPWSGNGHQSGGRKRVFEKQDIDELVGQWKRGEAHGQNIVKDAIVGASITSVRLGECDQVLPSDLLGCPLWRANAD